MSPSIPFEKWQGLGNDFVVVEEADVGPDFGPEEARRVCDRHFGVGADGVLVVARGAFGEASARMVVWNADGSRPEMCGNGLRSVAAYLAAEGSSDERVVATDAGPRRCTIARERRVAQVSIEMGRAQCGEPLRVPVAGREHVFSTVSMGNPHAITFEPYALEERDVVAPIASRAPAQGTNVEFVRSSDDGLHVFVWERGVGPTLACGTGACAVAVEAVRTGRAQRGGPVTVVLPGGPLEITVGEGDSVTMRGPAELVFRGLLARELLGSSAAPT